MTTAALYSFASTWTRQIATSWIDIGDIEDVPLCGVRLVKPRIGCVALFRTRDVKVFAASNICPHKGWPLSEGIVHDQSVTCPLHNWIFWIFDLNTGEAQGADKGRIDTYPVRVDVGRIPIDGKSLDRRSAA